MDRNRGEMDACQPTIDRQIDNNKIKKTNKQTGKCTIMENWDSRVGYLNTTYYKRVGSLDGLVQKKPE